MSEYYNILVLENFELYSLGFGDLTVLRFKMILALCFRFVSVFLNCLELIGFVNKRAA